MQSEYEQSGALEALALDYHVAVTKYACFTTKWVFCPHEYFPDNEKY